MKKFIAFALVASVLTVTSIGCGDPPKKDPPKVDTPKVPPKGGVETERPRPK